MFVGPLSVRPRRGFFRQLLLFVMLGLSSNTVQLFTSDSLTIHLLGKGSRKKCEKCGEQILAKLTPPNHKLGLEIKEIQMIISVKYISLSF